MTVGKPLVMSGVISDPNPVTIDLRQARPPIKVAVTPGSGNVARVEVLNAGTWSSWPYGDVSIPTVDSIESPVSSLRISKVSGSTSVTYEVMA